MIKLMESTWEKSYFESAAVKSPSGSSIDSLEFRIIRYFMFIHIKNVIFSHTLIVQSEQSSTTYSPIQRSNLLPFPLFLCLFVQVEAQNLQNKESHSMTANSSRQNLNIFPKTKQQLEHLQHNSGMQPLVGMFTKLQKVTTGFVMSPCTHGTAWLPLDEFLWNFTLETFMKICWETLNFVKIRHKYQALYVKTKVCVILLEAT